MVLLRPMNLLEGWDLDLLQTAISTFITITIIGISAAGVMKIFQLGTELGEIKSLLKDIRRNGEDLLPAGRASELARAAQLRDPGDTPPMSLLRAVSAEEYAAALQPEVIPAVDKRREVAEPVEAHIEARREA